MYAIKPGLLFDELVLERMPVQHFGTLILLEGGSETDLLPGTPGADLRSGGVGNDTLPGGNGADMLNGGAGNDLIESGALHYDPDGAGGADAILFAMLGSATHPALSASDFGIG